MRIEGMASVAILEWREAIAATVSPLRIGAMVEVESEAIAATKTTSRLQLIAVTVDSVRDPLRPLKPLLQANQRLLVVALDERYYYRLL